MFCVNQGIWWIILDRSFVPHNDLVGEVKRNRSSVSLEKENCFFLFTKSNLDSSTWSHMSAPKISEGNLPATSADSSIC